MSLDRTKRIRPAPPGVSIGEVGVTAGTLGLVVRDRQGAIYILSNNHVICRSNEAPIGSPVLQPGPYDGGRYPEDAIAHLSRCIEIRFVGERSTCPVARTLAFIYNFFAKLFRRKTRLIAVTEDQTNLVDAAVARVDNPSDVIPVILDLNIAPKGIRKAVVGMRVVKSGRTTGVTRGTVIDDDASIYVSFGNQIAFFEHQILIKGDNGLFSAPGDSGSSILSEDGYVVGLLFAGSDRVTVANPIEKVLELLDIEVITL